MRMSVVVGELAGSVGSQTQLLLPEDSTINNTTPSASPTPGSSSSLTSSSALSASTVTMVGQQAFTSAPVSESVQQQFGDVVKAANLRKLKGRKKYFVLRQESENGSVPARMEYYANERKFKLGQAPKKSIILKHCFNISRTESKCKYAIALHTHNDCVRIAMNSEEEMNEWLRIINSLTCDDEDEFISTINNTTDDQHNVAPLIPRPHFEHVWLVNAVNKGLGSKENIIGPYRLCLTSKELTLLKVGDHEERHSVLKFPLNVIRNVSHDATFGCFFHIEFGRLASTGPGQLSLKTEDNNIAQNMHLLILKAMQNYSKDDIIPRDNRRGRTYTWNSYNDSSSGSRHSSFHNQSHNSHGSHHGTTPPIMTRINSLDGSMRIRTESMGSQEARITGMSPPMPIIGHHNSLNSPMCSTTDSASSSYSVDYENNNNSSNNHRVITGYNHQQNSYGKSQDEEDEEEDESYVPWNPADEQHHKSSTSALPPSTSNNSLLTIQHQRSKSGGDENDYVQTTIGPGTTKPVTGGGSTSAPPSSHMNMQSPLSPFDNYLTMEPGTPLSSGESVKSGGKTSVPHSRTSSNIIDEQGGYVQMIPGTSQGRNESEVGSTAGSTTGLDESYFDMDLSRKLNLSNDDFPRMSPASSESLQSSTPSSDFPLEKVSSYLLSTDELDDNSGRPARAYSVGSRSDTSAVGKGGRYGKNRLEAVQETFRMRALSVGAKMQKPNTTPNTTKTTPENSKRGDKLGINTAIVASAASAAVAPAPLSNSWSGSTGKWPQKFPSPTVATAAPVTATTPVNQSSYHSQQNSDSVDSDLMELDFSHNSKRNRKRSLNGSTHIGLSGGGNSSLLGSIGSSIGSGGPKISPGVPKSACDTPETPSEGSKPSPFLHQYSSASSSSSSGSKYPSSAPISIQRTKCNNLGDNGDYMDTSGISILTRMTGLGVQEIKKMDNEGAYLEMDFGIPPKLEAVNTTSSSTIPHNTSSSISTSSPKSNPMVVIKPNESVPPSVFTLNSTNVPCVSSSPKLAFFGMASSSSPLSYFGTSTSSPPTQTTTIPSFSSAPPPTSLNLLLPSTPSTATATSSSLTTSTSPSSLSRIEESPEKQESSGKKSVPAESVDESAKITYASIDHNCLESTSPLKRPSAAVCPLNNEKSSGVTYSQIDFVKGSDGIKRN